MYEDTFERRYLEIAKVFQWNISLSTKPEIRRSALS